MGTKRYKVFSKCLESPQYCDCGVDEPKKKKKKKEEKKKGVLMWPV